MKRARTRKVMLFLDNLQDLSIFSFTTIWLFLQNGTAQYILRYITSQGLDFISNFFTDSDCSFFQISTMES